MPSLIPGYEYDIFISYRQKDNKYDGWVSEFVANLRRELEATFKEDVSIYFDANQRDGLLETHNVDKSLMGKLKCLICIPILSQTYCDPRSFAWNNEFLVFRNLAAADPYGLDVTLSNGNVVSRILPVRIHAVDARDRALFEKETGDPLRPIDFIFTSAGVNRPLRANEDHPHDNLNRTYYRDQINKVANLVKEIIFSLNPDSGDQVERGKLSVTTLKNSPPGRELTYFTTSGELATETVPQQRNWKTKMTMPLLLSVLVLAVLSAWSWLRPHAGSFVQIPTYSMIPIESGAGLIEQNRSFVIAPDGRAIAYSQGEKGINLRSLSGFSSKLLPGSENATNITFSPDQQSLAFFQNGGIYKIGIAGFPKSLISTMSVNTGMSWGIDGNIYFSGGLGSSGIWRVTSAGGGKPEQVTLIVDSLGENAHTMPQLLPDGKTLLFTALGASGGHEDALVVVENLESHERKILLEKAISGRYLSNGNLIYATNDGSVFRVPFDLQSLDVKGQPVAVLAGVTTGTWGGALFLDVSETGNLVFLPRSKGSQYVLNVVDRSGKSISGNAMASTILSGAVGHGWGNMEISPSGPYAALTGRSYGVNDIWLLHNDTGEADRITFNIAEEEYPVWSPDGKALAFTSAHTETIRRLFIKPLASTVSPRLIGTWPRHMHFSSWSPDGKWIAGYDFTPDGRDCWVVHVDGNKSIPVANQPANESFARFSPDGRWLTFQSDESGRSEVYVIAFPSLENKRQVSTEGGIQPRWDPYGRYIYYLQNGFMVAHPVQASDEFKKGKAERLFSTSAYEFTLSRDGNMFYLKEKDPAKEQQNLYLVINWFEELKKTGQ